MPWFWMQWKATCSFATIFRPSSVPAIHQLQASVGRAHAVRTPIRFAPICLRDSREINRQLSTSNYARLSQIIQGLSETTVPFRWELVQSWTFEKPESCACFFVGFVPFMHLFPGSLSRISQGRCSWGGKLWHTRQTTWGKIYCRDLQNQSDWSLE